MKAVRNIIVILVVLGIGAAVYWKTKNAPPASSDLPVATPTPAESESAKVQHPIQSPADDKEPIPKLDESDDSVQKKAPEFFGDYKSSDIVIFEGFIRHFVVAIENASGKQIPVAMSPLHTAPGDIVVMSSGDNTVLSEKNYDRYREYMELLKRANLQKISAYYHHNYSLFQAAYQDLGNQGYFNDKLIEAIDLIISTPEVKEPIRLKHNSIRYEFADPELESLPAIQKIVLRMGPRNANLLKEKSKELRAMLLN